MQHQENQNAIVSLERGIDILRVFRAEDTALGIHDLVRRTGLPKTTVARLAHTLVSLGYLEQTHHQGRYHLADKVIGLGSAVLSSLPVCRIAVPVLQEVADRFNMVAALGIGDQADMIYLAYCRSRDTVTLRMRTGALVPMYPSAIGRAWLRGIDAEKRAYHLRCIKETGADMTDVSRRLESAFEQIEKTGFCTSLGDWRSDMYFVAVPMVIDSGRTVLALNCGTSRHGLSASTFRNEVGPALKSAAMEISNMMVQLGLNFWDE